MKLFDLGETMLFPGLEADTIIADKAFNADERVSDPLRKAGKAIVIPTQIQ